MKIILEAKNICKYFGGLKAINNVNMSVNEGDIFGIIGPNGAGKTTFFNICSGIYAPTKGEIKFKCDIISKLSPERIAKIGISRTFQNIQLFKYMTVLENVKIGFHIRTKTNIFDAILHTGKYKKDETFLRDKAVEILEKVGLLEYEYTLAGNLAYGLQRKVEIARALALEPKILLLDEPAAGMNPIETKSLMDFIKKLNGRGLTILVIEHDMKFVMNACNRILVLNFGEKIAEGTPDDIKSNVKVHEAYFGKGIIAGEAIKGDA